MDNYLVMAYQYKTFENNLAFKYQYNLAFYVCTGKLLYSKYTMSDERHLFILS